MYPPDGRPTREEIEVTPGMMAAGDHALSGHSSTSAQDMNTHRLLELCSWPWRQFSDRAEIQFVELAGDVICF
jgi:hypothetical protein